MNHQDWAIMNWETLSCLKCEDRSTCERTQKCARHERWKDGPKTAEEVTLAGWLRGMGEGEFLVLYRAMLAEYERRVVAKLGQYRAAG